MTNYKIWNKKDDINGVNAQHFIDNLNIRDNDEIFLIIDSVGDVSNVEISRIIKSNYGLEQSLTVEEVAQEYINIREKERENAQKEQITLEQANEKISILEAGLANAEYAMMMGGLL